MAVHSQQKLATAAMRDVVLHYQKPITNDKIFLEKFDKVCFQKEKLEST